MKLRVGIIGLGERWESHHLPAFQALSDRFELRAVYDPVWHRALRAARQMHCYPVAGFRALAARPDVDAVMLFSSQFCGPLPIHAACEHGKAVYCGASLDLCQDAARRLRDRVHKSGVAFLAKLRCRQAPSTLRLKELIATRLGLPRLVIAERREPASSPSLTLGHQVMDQLMERIDWCRFVAGREPDRVSAVAFRDGVGELDDAVSYAQLQLGFPAEGGGLPVLAEIRYSRHFPAAWKEAASFRTPADFQVICEKGVAFVDLPSRITWFDEAGQHSETLEGERPVEQTLLLAFHRAVTSLVLNAANLEDAYRAVTIALAAKESARQGRPISLDGPGQHFSPGTGEDFSPR